MTYRCWEGRAFRVETVPQWRLGYQWCPYLRLGQAAHIWLIGPLRVYRLVTHADEA